MSEHNDPFFPQNVDESIDHLSSTRPFNTRGKQHGDANAHLIHDLETLYGTERKRRQQALQRVEDRLVRHYIAQDERSATNAASSFVGDAAERQRIDLWETQRIRRVQKMKDKPSSFTNGTSFGRSVGLLLVAAALIGSIALVLNYAHQRTAIPGTSAPITRPTPIPPTPTPTAGLSSSIGKTLYTTPANTLGFSGLSWSPDSKRVASLTGNSVQIWDATDGKNLVTVQIPDASEFPYAIDWSHHSQMLAVATDKHVLLVDGQSGKVIRSYTPGYATSMLPPVSSGGISYLGSQFPDSGGQGYRATTWSPDDQLMGTIISYGASEIVQIWNAQTGRDAFTLPTGSNGGIGPVVWSSDGQYIAATISNAQITDPTKPNGLIAAWKVSTHQMVFQHKDYMNNGEAQVVWQPASHNLAFAGATSTGKNTSTATIEIWNAETAKLVKQYVGAGVGALSWSPDGHYLAYEDFVKGTYTQVITIRDIITDKKAYTYTGHKYTVNEIVWSPDGNYIASCEGSTEGDMVAKVWVAK